MENENKKVAIMQPYVFPYIGYFQLIHSSDFFVFYDDVNFIKKGWINRNQILLHNEPYKFTIPLLGASQNKHINEIEVFWESGFDKKLIHQLEVSYRNAPYFADVMDLVYGVLGSKPKLISDLAISSILKTCEYIGLNRTFLRSSELKITKDLGRAERLIAITKQFSSSHYINAINGQELYDKEFFKQSGIDLGFLAGKMAPYSQGIETVFIPFLSIIDIMMWNHKNEILSEISSYEII